MRTLSASRIRSSSTPPTFATLPGQNVKSRLSKLRSYALVNGEDEDVPITVSFDKEPKSIAGSETRDRSIPSFQFYSSSEALPELQVNQSLLRLIGRKDTTAKPRKIVFGYIYAFILPTAPGYVKIGMTRQPPQNRINSQSSRCKLDYQWIHDDHEKKFPHFALVEKLIGKQLQNYRRKFTCSNCKKPHAEKSTEHAEWYEIDREKALAVIERWRRWVVEYEPYTKEQDLHAYWAEAVHKGLTKPDGIEWSKWLDPEQHDRVRYEWMRHHGGWLHRLMIKPAPSMLESFKIKGPACLLFAVALAVSGISLDGWVWMFLKEALDWFTFFTR